MKDCEDITARNNVNIVGTGSTTLMLAHGFGCDQQMWQYLLPMLTDHYRLVLFDYVGSGQSDLSAFSASRYRTLEGYARDVNEICAALDLENVVFVGHSVSAIIGLLAALEAPSRFAGHAMVCPSPCFLNKPPDYHGGFEREDLAELIALMDQNHLGWAHQLAPLVMGHESPQRLTDELTASFCSTDPLVARTFADATFFSDYRSILPQVAQPGLILQSASDTLANPSVGRYMHAHMPDSTLRILPTAGHAIHMTHPELVRDELLSFAA
ncbi:alpha/beta fold hydrolase [Spiribacter vilamensis]|uniref:Sigma-B regulation protein RsbQ n=1 Tax=Spiribacter vilamensis TaxID=531306 RepID=A0A4Q8D0D7_9GAMM|nr:alpha/beta hydrolase [Spiribacter vilamensis]RZU98753.1 sigma-B regulation protein RsbQ [Spiribacter vilamensis]TVO62225.1 alpha/beta hydrolase [Spiribacter vilamensis]